MVYTARVLLLPLALFSIVVLSLLTAAFLASLETLATLSPMRNPVEFLPFPDNRIVVDVSPNRTSATVSLRLDSEGPFTVDSGFATPYAWFSVPGASLRVSWSSTLLGAQGVVVIQGIVNSGSRDIALVCQLTKTPPVSITSATAAVRARVLLSIPLALQVVGMAIYDSQANLLWYDYDTAPTTWTTLLFQVPSGVLNSSTMYYVCAFYYVSSSITWYYAALIDVAEINITSTMGFYEGWILLANNTGIYNLDYLSLIEVRSSNFNGYLELSLANSSWISNPAIIDQNIVANEQSGEAMLRVSTPIGVMVVATQAGGTAKAALRYWLSSGAQVANTIQLIVSREKDTASVQPTRLENSFPRMDLSKGGAAGQRAYVSIPHRLPPVRKPLATGAVYLRGFRQ